ncbi:UDP-Glycosyltransferase/glycogen phosphorylase [Sanghuangporus baumii]|uniref:UDP-Glycosyltransferase/glycogen phosphorylase n=1 Tax=Sanghuangporus baumii TaxID=108892 RepID=A0A9Q5I3Y6_SANBA|nr:UDP-Glycosyltransferase/glycogen phosphorylase [Sanghuangporus baumii]
MVEHSFACKSTIEEGGPCAAPATPSRTSRRERLRAREGALVNDIIRDSLYTPNEIQFHKESTSRRASLMRCNSVRAGRPTVTAIAQYLAGEYPNPDLFLMTVPQQSPEGRHIVAVALPMWGHTKPLCALLAKIVRLRRVYATLFTDVMSREKVLDEIERQFSGSNEEELKGLIRVVALPSSTSPHQYDPYKSSFVEAYKILHAEKSIAVSPENDLVYDSISAPQAVIVDLLCYEILKGIRSISGIEVPVYAWQSGAATAVLYLFGPENLGGNGDLAEKINKIAAESPDIQEKEIEKIYRSINQKLVELPGLPPMYDYEHIPQTLPIRLPSPLIRPTLRDLFFVECDGVIHCTNRIFEGAALSKFQEWFGSKPVLAVGPLSPPASVEDVEREKSKSPIGQEVEVFLNNALDEFGQNSVVYISFGTVWWSSEPEKIWTFIDVLLEQGIPFLLSHASPVAIIPDELSIRVKASGLGYISKRVLNLSEACGWFVSHCGHNSVMESLTAGVPLICWPYDADQPTNAVNVTSVHEVGYELFEVRNGYGLRPIHRLGNKSPTGTQDAVRQEAIDVFTKAQGRDGEDKRAKAQWLSAQFAKFWQETGEGWAELKKIVDRLE